MGYDYGLGKFAADEARHRKQQIRNFLVLLVTVAVGLGAIVYVAKDVKRSFKSPPGVQGTTQAR